MATLPTPRLIIRFHNRLSLLRLWRPDMRNPAPLMGVLDDLLDAVHRHQARQLLLNLQRLPPFDHTLQEWLQTSWLPRLRRSGIQRLAVLLPQDVYNLMVVEGLLWASARRVLPYEVQYFTEWEAALDWLSDAELPTTAQDWPKRWHRPTLLRLRLRHKRRRPQVAPAGT